MLGTYLQSFIKNYLQYCRVKTLTTLHVVRSRHEVRFVPFGQTSKESEGYYQMTEMSAAGGLVMYHIGEELQNKMLI